ncbi:MAG: fructose-6-phosphate aldolase [Myxococcota bacterium]
MQIFIDSADLAEIRDAVSMGLVDGVTTNPSLIAKTGKPLKEVIVSICEVVQGPISAEVIATEYSNIVDEALQLAALHDNVVVKVPLIADGLRAVRTLSDQGIRTNVTLCFSPTQALLAAKAGATYISPFVGRVDDVSGDGLDLLQQILDVYRNYEVTTKVLAASIRHPYHVVQGMLMGVDVATLPLAVIQQLIKHPLTDRGLERFLADAKKIPEQ